MLLKIEGGPPEIIWFMMIMTIMMMMMKFTTIDVKDDWDLGTAENSNCINSSPIMNALWTMMRMMKHWRWWWWRWWWWDWWWWRGSSRFRISWPPILNQAMIGENMPWSWWWMLVDYDDSDDEEDDQDWGTAENSNCISSPLSKKRKPHLLVSAAGGRNQNQNCSLQRKYKIWGWKCENHKR